MQNKIEFKKSGRLFLIAIPLLLIIRIGLDYKNFKDGNAYLKREINHYIILDRNGKGMRLIDKNIKFEINFYSSYCGSKIIINDLIDKIAPNDVNTKLFVTKESNSNIFKTIINDTCYQFKIEPQSGMYGDFFGEKNR